MKQILKPPYNIYGKTKYNKDNYKYST